MFRRWRVRDRPDASGALSLMLAIATCAAYGVFLTIGVLLFGLSRSPEAPVVPQHDVHRHQVNSKFESTPKGHVHPNHEHLRGHDAHKRVSPKELSLAKW